MPTFKIAITQHFRVTRKITIEVEADDLDNAIEEVDAGAIDTPNFDDPGWKSGWVLMNESVEPG